MFTDVLMMEVELKLYLNSLSKAIFFKFLGFYYSFEHLRNAYSCLAYIKF